MEFVDNEIWIDMNDRFSNHQLSSYGRVRNKKTGHILKPSSDRYGYSRVSIGNTDNVYIHRLVCEYFYGESPENRPQVNHIDCDRQNNHVLNLEYCSPKENVNWGVHKGNIKPQKGLRRAIEVNLKPVRIMETGEIFNSVKECAKHFGVAPTNISRCLTGERKGQKIHGCHVEYI